MLAECRASKGTKFVGQRRNKRVLGGVVSFHTVAQLAKALRTETWHLDRNAYFGKDLPFDLREIVPMGDLTP